MPQFAIHVKTRESKLLPASIILTYYAKEDVGTFLRLLKHRGVDHTFLAQRFATEEEMMVEDHHARLELHCYISWDKLIIDENKYSQDEKWFDTLVGLQKQFPQFNNH